MTDTAEAIQGTAHTAHAQPDRRTRRFTVSPDERQDIHERLDKFLDLQPTSTFVVTSDGGVATPALWGPLSITRPSRELPPRFGNRQNERGPTLRDQVLSAATTAEALAFTTQVLDKMTGTPKERAKSAVEVHSALHKVKDAAVARNEDIENDPQFIEVVDRLMKEGFGFIEVDSTGGLTD